LERNVSASTNQDKGYHSMKNSTAKKIVKLLSDQDFMDNHNMKEKAWWVRKIDKEDDEEQKHIGYVPARTYIR
jgi:hypothetical protein